MKGAWVEHPRVASPLSSSIQRNKDPATPLLTEVRESKTRRQAVGQILLRSITQHARKWVAKMTSCKDRDPIERSPTDEHVKARWSGPWLTDNKRRSTWETVRVDAALHNLWRRDWSMDETRSGHCQGGNQDRHQNFLERQYQEICTCQHRTADARLKIKVGSGHRSPEGIAWTRPKRQQPTQSEVLSIWPTKFQEDRCDGRTRRPTQKEPFPTPHRGVEQRAGEDEMEFRPPRDARQHVGSEERTQTAKGDVLQDAQWGTCDVADDLFCFKASLREAPLTSNHSGYGSNTTNQIEDRNWLRLLMTVCNATGTL